MRICVINQNENENERTNRYNDGRHSMQQKIDHNGKNLKPTTSIKSKSKSNRKKKGSSLLLTQKQNFDEQHELLYILTSWY